MSNRSLLCGEWPAFDCDEWPAPFDAFPVEAPFQVKPDLTKLVPADDWLRVDRQWRVMLAAKQSALLGDESRHAGGNIALASPCDRRTEERRKAAVARAIEKLANSAAGHRLGIVFSAGATVDFRAAGYRVEDTESEVHWQTVRADASPLAPVAGRVDGSLRLLSALALSVQEDLVLMEQGADAAVAAALFHVSFPSTWNPATRLGQDLHALHAPVADNAPLQAAAGSLGRALVSKGPFARWVWTVTTDPRWRAWPVATRPPARAEAAARATHCAPLFFRLERQTTMPLGDGYGLFLIRVQVRPLGDVLSQPGRRSLLQASLRSMSDDMVRYKNLAGVRDRLLAA
jgi:hypothetical protein